MKPQPGCIFQNSASEEAHPHSISFAKNPFQDSCEISHVTDLINKQRLNANGQTAILKSEVKALNIEVLLISNMQNI